MKSEEGGSHAIDRRLGFSFLQRGVCESVGCSDLRMKAEYATRGPGFQPRHAGLKNLSRLFNVQVNGRKTALKYLT